MNNSIESIPIVSATTTKGGCLYDKIGGAELIPILQSNYMWIIGIIIVILLIIIYYNSSTTSSFTVKTAKQKIKDIWYKFT